MWAMLRVYLSIESFHAGFDLFAILQLFCVCAPQADFHTLFAF